MNHFRACSSINFSLNSISYREIYYNFVTELAIFIYQSVHYIRKERTLGIAIYFYCKFREQFSFTLWIPLTPHNRRATTTKALFTFPLLYHVMYVMPKTTYCIRSLF